MVSPRRFTSDTTELAKERNRQAAERTLVSWIQASLGLIGFGAAFQSIFDAVNQTFPQNDSVVNQQIASGIGLSAIGLGVFLLALALLPYRNHIKSLERADFLNRPLRLFDLGLLVMTITLYGLVALVAVLLV